MSFPTQENRSHRNYDFDSIFIGLVFKGTTVATVGIGTGAITYIALKALGFTKTAAASVAVIPVGIGVIGAIGYTVALTAAVILGLFIHAFFFNR